MALSDKIYLVGMPGSGKSTFGVELASVMNLPFIDLDNEIELSEKRTITQIFEKEGEQYFRKVENLHLKKISEENDFFVMSTGGGTPCYHHGIDIMHQHGVTLYLKVEVEQLLLRLANTDLSTRPKFEKNSDLHKQLSELLNTRESVYRKANIVCRQDELDSLQVIEKIKGIT